MKSVVESNSCKEQLLKNSIMLLLSINLHLYFHRAIYFGVKALFDEGFICIDDNALFEFCRNRFFVANAVGELGESMKFGKRCLSGKARDHCTANRGTETNETKFKTLCVPSSDCNMLQTLLLQRLGSGGWSTCVFAGFGLCVASCASSDRFATMTVSGCPCSKLRAALFMFLLTASKLALAVRLCFGARTPCCGHGLDYRRRQSHCRSGKLEQLNNQVHGRITSFRGRGRCQHTGLTPLTLHDCIINTRTNVSKYKVNSSIKYARRAA